MPLEMNREVFITCPVTGSGGTQDRSPHVPRSPEQIANSAIAAAKAGAAVVHCHVRDPETGAPSRDPVLYRELTEHIRAAGTDENLVLTKPVKMTLEQALEFIDNDELVEVTPNHIRIRKRHLQEHERKRAARGV